MQKAKKMSKQTLVVAVLAILLVLSLALSVTGAWFTDTATDDSEIAIEFATVDVGVTAGTSTHYDADDAAVTTRDLVPGDYVTLSGSITNGTSTVDIYVAVIIGDITIMGADGDTTYDIDLSNLVTQGLITTEAVAFETDSGLSSDVTLADGKSKVYKIEAGENAVTYDYAGKVVFTTDLPNEVEIGGQKYLLNAGATGSAGAITITGVEVKATVEVFAIQADNIADATAAAAEIDELRA